MAMALGCPIPAAARASRRIRAAPSVGLGPDPLDPVGVEDLERDAPMQERIVRAVHLSHSPLSEELGELVAAKSVAGLRRHRAPVYVDAAGGSEPPFRLAPSELDAEDRSHPDRPVVVGELLRGRRLGGSIDVVDPRVDARRPPEISEVDHERRPCELVRAHALKEREASDGSENSTRIQYSSPAWTAGVSW